MTDSTGKSLASDAHRLERLGAMALTAFAEQETLDKAAGEEFYPRLRADLSDAGAKEEDFEPLTALLVRLVLEGDKVPNEKARKTQLSLISTHFAFRDFTVKVENGNVSIVMLPLPIKH